MVIVFVLCYGSKAALKLALLFSKKAEKDLDYLQKGPAFEKFYLVLFKAKLWQNIADFWLGCGNTLAKASQALHTWLLR